MASQAANLWVLLGLGLAGILMITKKLKKTVREDFGAFIDKLLLLPPPQPAPPKAPHPLTGLTFAVSDVWVAVYLFLLSSPAPYMFMIFNWGFRWTTFARVVQILFDKYWNLRWLRSYSSPAHYTSVRELSRVSFDWFWAILLKFCWLLIQMCVRRLLLPDISWIYKWTFILFPPLDLWR